MFAALKTPILAGAMICVLSATLAQANGLVDGLARNDNAATPQLQGRLDVAFPDDTAVTTLVTVLSRDGFQEGRVRAEKSDPMFEGRRSMRRNIRGGVFLVCTRGAVISWSQRGGTVFDLDAHVYQSCL